MHEDGLKQAAALLRSVLRRYQNRKTWQRIVMILSCACVFVTTYLLILPAITIDRQTADADAGIVTYTSQAAGGYAYGGVAAAGENAGDSGFLEGTRTVWGSDYVITAWVQASACLPKEARLTATEIRGEEYDTYYAQALSALGVEAIPFARFFDIRFEVLSDDGWIPVEPKDTVRIAVDTGRAAEGGETPVTLHFDSGNSAENGAGEESIEEDSEEKDTTEEAEDPVSECAPDPLPEILPAKACDTDISFDADSFSVFGVGYTVDFHYGGYTFSIPGGTYIWLSDVLEELHSEGTRRADAGSALRAADRILHRHRLDAGRADPVGTFGNDCRTDRADAGRGADPPSLRRL